jgi:hypothetical protein
VLRSLHSRSVAEADTEEAVVVVAVSMEEVGAEAASTVAVVEAADSMEAVAAVMAAERIAAVVVHIAAAVAAVHTAADRRVAPLEVRTAEAAGTRRADTAAERMAAGDRVARTEVAREIRRTRGKARDRVRGVQIR